MIMKTRLLSQKPTDTIRHLEDKIVVSCIHAMGIINSHFTLPLMLMIDMKDITVMSAKYYTRLHECVNEWMIN